MRDFIFDDIGCQHRQCVINKIDAGGDDHPVVANPSAILQFYDTLFGIYRRNHRLDGSDLMIVGQ